MFVVIDDGTPTVITFRELRKRFRNISFSTRPKEEDLNALGVYVLNDVSMPTDVVVTGAGTPVADGNRYTRVWETRPFNASERAAQARKEEIAQRRQAVVNDSQVRNLFRGNPQQIDNFIDNRVNSLDSAKDLMKVLARAIAVLAEDILE